MTSSKAIPPPPSVKLFPGEEMSFDHAADDATDVQDADVERKYAAGEVRIVTEQARYPLNTIASMVDSDDYELSPEFQRRHRWSVEKRSRLIESFIINVPVPPIFLYEDEYSHYEVMDGLQRLSAIAAFYNDEFALSGLTEWAELNGRRYSEIPHQIRRGIDRRYLSSIILLRETAKTNEEAQRLKQMVFERINSGGERLEPQESRNAIYNGPFNEMCLRLSRNKFLCRLWGIPEPDFQIEHDTHEFRDRLQADPRYRKMEDVELVLRFFAHRQRRRIGEGALKTYLDAYLKQGNLLQEEVREHLEAVFRETIGLVHDVLGPSAFWLWRYRHGKWAWLERPTTSAYDAVMFCFSSHLADASDLRRRATLFREAMPRFYEENFNYFDARLTNMRNLRERDGLVEELILTVLSQPPSDA